MYKIIEFLLAGFGTFPILNLVGPILLVGTIFLLPSICPTVLVFWNDFYIIDSYAYRKNTP